MTNKKCLVALILLGFVAAWSFAQTDDLQAAEETDDVQPVVQRYSEKSPMNTVTVDIGPTIIGAAIGVAGDAIGGEEGLNSSGFGIAAQYERQILENLTVGGRFAYLGGGIGISMGTVEEQGVNVDTSLSMNISSFSVEGHVRYYPWAQTFFLDGMLGYANMSADFSGSVVVSENNIKQKESISFNASRSYFKLGAKIGWRVDFGEPGGFIFEPSFGWYGGIGLGDTLGKQLTDDINRQMNGDVEEMGELDFAFSILENFIFVGGPRFALSFGWRF
jgi:hypothetical protein